MTETTIPTTTPDVYDARERAHNGHVEPLVIEPTYVGYLAYWDGHEEHFAHGRTETDAVESLRALDDLDA